MYVNKRVELAQRGIALSKMSSSSCHYYYYIKAAIRRGKGYSVPGRKGKKQDHYYP